jgi:hypothetical protein
MVSGSFCICSPFQHLPAYSLQGRVENLCVKFSFHITKKERYSESPDLTDGRTVSLPNPCATAGGIAIGHHVFHIHLTSVTLIIPTMSGFIVSAYLSWIYLLTVKCECSSACEYLCCSAHSIVIKSPLFLTVVSVCLLHFLVLGPCDIPFVFGLVWSGLVCSGRVGSGLVWRRNYPYNPYIIFYHILLLSWLVFSLWHMMLSNLCYVLVFLPQVHFYVISV